ncbi:MAG: phytoene desaturase [Candidatus Aminicenantes bacterium]|nr:phytoene desaturase [Candidatus Aminicenantes bacterium]
MSDSKKRIVVVGAGLAGLAASALLAKEGYSVTVVDKNPTPGGVARQETLRGFSFDLGPSWYLMPEVYDRYFGHFGKKTSDFFTLVDLDPSYRVFFEGQGRADIVRDPERNARLFDSFEEGGGESLKRYLANSRAKYDLALNQFLYKDYRSLFDLFDLKLLRGGLRLGFLSRLHDFVKKHFRDHRSQKIVEFNTVFLGCSPYKTPALYSLMAHADLTQGVCYPPGGIVKLAEAFHACALENGARFFFDAEAEKVLVEDGRAGGVSAAGEFLPADIVLLATDYHHAETRLLDAPWRNYPARYWRRKVLAPGMFLIYLGLDKKVDSLAHHNFYFARDWKSHFVSLFNKPSWPENPCYYIGCASKTDALICPANGECLFLLVPVSPDLDDSDERRESFEDAILGHCEGILGESIRRHVVVKKVFSQRDFRDHHHYLHGTALGLAHTLGQTAFLRPSHRNKRIGNLYYTGHYTPPGIGMPMTVISAELVLGLIKKEHPV